MFWIGFWERFAASLRCHFGNHFEIYVPISRPNTCPMHYLTSFIGNVSKCYTHTYPALCESQVHSPPSLRYLNAIASIWNFYCMVGWNYMYICSCRVLLLVHVSISTAYVACCIMSLRTPVRVPASINMRGRWPAAETRQNCCFAMGFGSIFEKPTYWHTMTTWLTLISWLVVWWLQIK